MYSSYGRYTTSESDVSELFSEHLERALADADRSGRALKILFYAHGGLVSEEAGIGIAERQVDWWKKNGIYPIYFAWETGFLATLRSILKDAAEELGIFRARDIWDHTTDPLLEAAGRALGSTKIWAAMKRSAERANIEGGGGHHFATRLADFLARHEQSKIELHAVGHSAGAIFQSHFIPQVQDLTSRRFSSLALLAPAVTAQLFKESLVPAMSREPEQLTTVFTMQEELERRDSCVGIYMKSLLYFVSNSCETRRYEPILGLEESIRSDAAIRDYFNLNAFSEETNKRQIIWSRTERASGRSASQSVTHGGFDDDPPTMEAVLRRVLQYSDDDQIAVRFPAVENQRSINSFAKETLVDWPEELAYVRRQASYASQPLDLWEKADAREKAGPLRSPRKSGPSSRKMALCIGINRYRNKPLSYCVRDAERWNAALSRRGFAVRQVTDAEATRDNLLDALEALISSSEHGDVLAIQYAGHGALSPYADLDPDTPDDNALVPIDGEDGRLIFDLELRSLFDRVPNGVNISCFFDCCHSETSSREFKVALMLNDAWPHPSGDSRSFVLPEPVARFIDPTESMRESFKTRTQRSAASGKRSSAELPGSALRDGVSRTAESMKNVMFAACRDRQLAFEEAGSGRYTSHALNVLEWLGERSITNQSFHDHVEAQFRKGSAQSLPYRNQDPRLDCAQMARLLPFLEPAAELRRSVI